MAGGWPALVTVAAGGLIGSLARAGVGLLLGDRGFPASVLIVNLVGSFMLGFYLARRERAVSRRHSLQFWAIGVLGSFTTFSAFTVDLVLIVDGGRSVAALVYLIVSLVGGLVSALAGLRLGAVTE